MIVVETEGQWVRRGAELRERSGQRRGASVEEESERGRASRIEAGESSAMG